MTKRIIILLCAAAALVGAYFAGRVYYDRKVPNFKDISEIYVYPDTPVEYVVAQILRESSPKWEGSVRRAFASVGSVKPGHYTIDASCSSTYAARMMALGWQTPINLVFAGSMRSVGAIAKRISSQMMADSLAAAEALQDSTLLASLGFRPAEVFALIIPDTYEVYWTDSVEDILRRQKKAYDAFWTDDNIARARAQGLTPMEASVLASIVKGETNYEPEMPSIAGVYLNRLHKGEKLQADPTVAFCFDYEPKRILRWHTQVDSPYNTYKYAGLPPAPICVPTKACLNAVLKPDTHRYMFFCASPELNGTHRFAVTYSEHLVNARAYQRAITIRNKNR
ncbi:MAG: endolytic transglycosylase MltG [Bacteroidales bacterium]|nr:endolytic transglycosylase MltG [Bacteroidales bacterium]